MTVVRNIAIDDDTPLRRRDLIVAISPNTPIAPETAVAIAYSDGLLSKQIIEDAIARRELDHEIMAGRTFVTLAGLSEFVRSGRRDIVAVNGVVGSIYFAGFGRYIKIGFTLGTVEDRLRNLQTAAPELLTLHATIYGTTATEADLHRRFSRYRLRGEWFQFRSPIRRLIDVAWSRQWQRDIWK